MRRWCNRGVNLKTRARISGYEEWKVNIPLQCHILGLIKIISSGVLNIAESRAEHERDALSWVSLREEDKMDSELNAPIIW